MRAAREKLRPFPLHESARRIARGGMLGADVDFAFKHHDLRAVGGLGVDAELGALIDEERIGRIDGKAPGHRRDIGADLTFFELHEHAVDDPQTEGAVAEKFNA
jgi:hypothetical protein